MLAATIMLYCIIWVTKFYFQKTTDPIFKHYYIKQDIKEAFESEYNFVVTEKYLDTSNHDNETIIGKTFDNREQRIYGSPGYWELYKFVSKGDTIIKKRKSFKFSIKNNNKRSFNIYTYLKDSY